MTKECSLLSKIHDEHFVVIDDFLTPSYHGHILSNATSEGSQWHYHSNITYQPDVNFSCSDPGDYGFGNLLNMLTNDGVKWKDPFYIPFCYQIQDLLPPTTIGRVRFDMTCYNPEGRIHQAHIDTSFPHYASIYYVNDTDGDTIIYNQTFDGDFQAPPDLTIMTTLKPKANRLLIFDGKYFHTGSSPTKHKTRIIINSNFHVENEKI